MNDITIFLRNEEDHVSHLRVVETLNNTELDPSFSMSKFWFDVVVFLRHIVYGQGIRFDTNKIERV